MAGGLYSFAVMKIIALLFKLLIFLPMMVVLTLGILFSVVVGLALFFITGRRKAQFKVYTSRDFQGVFTRPPMRDVTPRSTAQLTNE